MTKDNSYFKRIGEVFDGFTLIAYQNDSVDFYTETEQTKRKFVMTCPAGHKHTYPKTNLTPETCEKHCWCQKQKPLKRERLRAGLTIAQAARLFYVNVSMIPRIEAKHFTSRDELKPYFDGYQTPKVIQEQLIQEMILTGQLKE